MCTVYCALYTVHRYTVLIYCIQNSVSVIAFTTCSWLQVNCWQFRNVLAVLYNVLYCTVQCWTGTVQFRNVQAVQCWTVQCWTVQCWTVPVHFRTVQCRMYSNKLYTASVTGDVYSKVLYIFFMINLSLPNNIKYEHSFHWSNQWAGLVYRLWCLYVCWPYFIQYMYSIGVQSNT